MWPPISGFSSYHFEQKSDDGDNQQNMDNSTSVISKNPIAQAIIKMTAITYNKFPILFDSID